MQPLTAHRLLRVWERGFDQDATGRALVMLAEARPGTRRDDLWNVPIGRRDADLLALRAATFGPQLEAITGCPSCGERLELGLSADQMHGPRHEDVSPPAPLQLGEFELALRLPDSTDLAAAARSADIDTARRTIAHRCITSARRCGAEMAPDGLPDELLPAVAAYLETADPGAALVVETCCPACGASWESAFDVADFLWSEIEAEALRLLRDVHRLARGYGWCEADILALSPLRRRAYLELLPP